MESALRWIGAAWVATGVSAAWSGHALADVKIGVTVSATGPARSFGVPEKNAIARLPKEVAGQKIDYIVLDDGTDATRSVRNARKLISEDHVDPPIGETVVPNSPAMIDIAVESTTPMISMTAAASIVESMDVKRAALENTKDMPASHGIFNMSANDQAGLGQRTRVMVEIAGGKWKLSGA